jgi:hypothetical protein
MNINIDSDLASQAKAIARNNGISVAKYVNGLLESALNGEIERAKSQALDEKRRKVLERLWDNHKFPKEVCIEATNGWDSAGGDVCMDFTRVFFYSEGGQTGDTSRGIVNVHFEGKSTKPASFSFRDCHGNNL